MEELKPLPFTFHFAHRQSTFGNDYLACMEHINNKDGKGKDGVREMLSGTNKQEPNTVRSPAVHIISLGPGWPLWLQRPCLRTESTV